MTEIAKEYAAALFLLAKENGSEAAFADGLQAVNEQFEQNPSYIGVLASPVIPKAERKAALEAAFADCVPQEVLAFLQLLCQNGHIRTFADCYEAYMDAFRELQKVSVAHVTSATPLTQQEQDALVRVLTEQSGHTVRTEYAVDPALLGGIAVDMDGFVMDGSLKNRLRELKEVISL